MVENIPAKGKLDPARGDEKPPPREISEGAVQRSEEEHPGNRPNQPLPAVGRGEAVNRIPDHPRDQEPEETGNEQAEGAQEERRPVAGQVWAEGEQLADGGIPPYMGTGFGVKQTRKSAPARMPTKRRPLERGTSS